MTQMDRCVGKEPEPVIEEDSIAELASEPAVEEEPEPETAVEDEPEPAEIKGISNFSLSNSAVVVVPVPANPPTVIIIIF